MEKTVHEKLEQLRSKITEEEQMIEDYESQIDDLREEIQDYENEYDYESDPNGNDFDLNHIHNLNEEIEVIENLISRCESEIDITEKELEEIHESKKHLKILTDSMKTFEITDGDLIYIYDIKFLTEELCKLNNDLYDLQRSVDCIKCRIQELSN